MESSKILQFLLILCLTASVSTFCMRSNQHTSVHQSSQLAGISYYKILMRCPLLILPIFLMFAFWSVVFWSVCQIDDFSFFTMFSIVFNTVSMSNSIPYSETEKMYLVYFMSGIGCLISMFLLKKLKKTNT